MGFNDNTKQSAIIAQNVSTTAGNIVAALINTRGDTSFPVEEFEAIRDLLFQGVFDLAGVGTVIEKFEPSTSTQTYSSSAPPSGGGGGDGAPYADTELKFGKHRGKTIAQVDDEDRGWLEWAAGNSNNDFIKKAVGKYLAATAA